VIEIGELTIGTQPGVRTDNEGICGVPIPAEFKNAVN
jgi:hypothetical protein